MIHTLLLTQFITFYGVDKHYHDFGISVIILTNGVVFFSSSILEHTAVFNKFSLAFCWNKMLTFYIKLIKSIKTFENAHVYKVILLRMCVTQVIIMVVIFYYFNNDLYYTQSTYKAQILTLFLFTVGKL